MAARELRERPLFIPVAVVFIASFSASAVEWLPFPTEGLAMVSILAAIGTVLTVLIPVRAPQDEDYGETGIESAGEDGNAGKATVRDSPDYGFVLQLPPLPDGLFGKDEAIAKMREALDSVAVDPLAVPVVVVYGPPGSGTTTLAIAFAHRILAEGRFPDGLLYGDLLAAGGRLPPREPVPGGTYRSRDSTIPPDVISLSPGAVLSDFLRALGVAHEAIPTRLDDQVYLFSHRLLGQRRLIILDEAQSPDQVRPLIPSVPGCAVVITSRTPIQVVPRARMIEVPPLTVTDAVGLLAAQLQSADRVAAEPAAAIEIVRLCDLLPQMITLVGKRQARRRLEPLAQLVTRLRGDADLGRTPRYESGLLAELPANERIRGIWRAGFTVGYESLPPQEQLALRLSLLVPSSVVSPWMLAALLDTDLRTAADRLDRLAEAQLIAVARTGADGWRRYRPYVVTRLYGWDRLLSDEPMAARKAAVERLIGAFLTLAEAVVHRLSSEFAREHRTVAPRWAVDPDLGDLAELDPVGWLVEEARPLGRLVSLAVEYELWDQAWELAWFLGIFYEEIRSGWRGWAQAFDLAVDAAYRVDDRYAEAIAHLSRATYLQEDDRFDDAAGEFSAALDHLSDAGSGLIRGRIERRLGETLRAQGQFEQSGEHLQTALELATRAGDVRGAALARRSLGHLLTWQRHSDRALPLLHAALRRFVELDDQHNRAATQRILGRALKQLGQFADASAALAEADRIFATRGNRVWQARTWYLIGQVRRAEGLFDQAERDLNEALLVFQEYSSQLWSARTHRQLAILASAQGRLVEAEREARRAVAQFARIGFPYWDTIGLSTLGYVRYGQGALEEAAEILERVAANFSGVGWRWLHAQALSRLGVVRADQGRLDDAVSCQREAIRHFREHGDRPYAARALERLADIRERQRAPVEAARLRLRARRLRPSTPTAPGSQRD
jgi:tetratricopeptide (TPR) repeat protein